jgi:DNA repair exonuclease SbcCD ATPase subunit
MKELVFKSVEIRNFLSVGNRPLMIEFDRGLTFVCGWNHHTSSSNGVGKTVIFYSSILYALFGETGRGIKQANIINYRNKAKMYVKLVLEKNGEEVTIYRSRKPNLFYYIHNGTKYQNNDVHETQNQLNKLLDVSEDIFSNVFIINASDTIEFIKEEGSVKLRDRFERIFFRDIIFKRVLETVRKEYNSVQKDIELNNSKMQEKLSFLKRMKSLIESSKKVDDYEKQLAKYNKQSQELQQKATLLENTISQRGDAEKLKTLQTKRKEYITKRGEFDSKIYHLTEKIKETKEKMDTILAAESICPLCRQTIDSHTTKKLQKEYQNSIRESGEEKTVFEGQRTECDKKLEKIEQLENQLQTVMQKYSSKKMTISNAISQINQQMRFFQENYKDHLGLVQEFDKVKSSLLQIRDSNAKLSMEKGDLELLSQLFDNSSGGIMNFFIEKVLKILNQTIAKFIKKMQLDFTFYLDNDLKLRFDIYDTLSLNNFSGGEKKLINFIVFFSLIEFFYHTVGFKPSVLVIDEIADTAISGPKVDVIFEILDEFHKENNVGIYCLSHDYSVQHNSVINFDTIIELEKGDFTTIKEIKNNK